MTQERRWLDDDNELSEDLDVPELRCNLLKFFKSNQLFRFTSFNLSSECSRDLLGQAESNYDNDHEYKVCDVVEPVEIACPQIIQLETLLNDS